MLQKRKVQVSDALSICEKMMSTFSSNLTQLAEKVTCQILSVAEFTG